MSETSTQFELVEFEQVEAAPGTALLRVAARPSASSGSGPLTLVIRDGEREYRHPQLPALPGPPGLVRAAFSAPLEHVARGAIFALEFPGGSLIRLPAPSRRRPAGPGMAPVVNAVERRSHLEETESSRLAEAERRAEARRLAITELERRLAAERERRHSAESDIARLRADRTQALADRDEAFADRDEAIADRDRAEARGRAVAANAGGLEGQLRAAAEAAERAHDLLQAQLLEREGELERLRGNTELAQARAHANRREVAELDEQLAHAQAQIAVLELALEQSGDDAKTVGAETEAALAQARAEAAQARHQLAEMDARLDALQGLAQRTDTEHTYDLETTQARLGVAHAELEVARTEIEALQHRGGELQTTVADLDGVLAARAAEIELLRDAVGRAGAEASAQAGQQLQLELICASTEAAVGARAAADLLRAQTLAQSERLTAITAELAATAARADTAEAELASRTADLTEFGERVSEQIESVNRSRTELVAAAEQTQHELAEERRRAEALAQELQKVREAAALVAAELLKAGDAASSAQAESESHRRHVAELSESLASAERTMRQASDAIATHELRHHEIKEALRLETERRVRAEEALVTASAERSIVAESLVAEAGARERAALQREQLIRQSETLFGRLADEHAQSQAQLEVLRQLT